MKSKGLTPSRLTGSARHVLVVSAAVCFSIMNGTALGAATLASVLIVNDAEGTWKSETTPDPVAHDATVKLRLVLKMNGADHTYYWGYATATVEGLGQVHEWNEGICGGDPTVSWQKVLPKMKPSPSNDNDPWNLDYNHYTNVVANDGTTTAKCPHNKTYANPGEPYDLSKRFNTIPCTDPTHTCTSTKYLGLQSRTNEGNGCAIIEYTHAAVAGTWQIAVDGEVGVTHHTVKATLGTATKHARGKEVSTTVSHLIFDTTHPEQAYNRGVKDEVMRVVRKSDHSSNYVKHIESFKRAPWVYGSWSFQAPDYIGFDCADLAQAAAYRAGLSTAKTHYADGLKGTRPKIGGADEPYRLVAGVLKKADGTDASILIGTDINIGDLVMIDWDNDGKADHTTVLYSGTGALSGADTLIFAGRTGVTTETISGELPASKPNARVYLRTGW